MLLDTSTIIAGITGSLIPLLISALVAEDASPKYKVGMTYAIYMIAALLITILKQEVILGDGPLDLLATGKLLLMNIAAVVVLANSLYLTAYKKSGLTSFLEQRGSSVGKKSARKPRKKVVE